MSHEMINYPQKLENLMIYTVFKFLAMTSGAFIAII